MRVSLRPLEQCVCSNHSHETSHQTDLGQLPTLLGLNTAESCQPKN